MPVNGSKIIVKSSAPGKILLSGEHSVVYGKNAIGFALNLRITCSIYQKFQHSANSSLIDCIWEKKETSTFVSIIINSIFLYELTT